MEPLEVWTDDLESLLAIQRKRGGVIVKKVFMAPDIVMSPETLGMDRKHLVRSLSESTKFSVSDIMIDSGAGGWNPVKP